MARLQRAPLLFAAKLIFSGLLLWLVLARLNYGDIASRLRTANPRWLALALLCSLAVMALSARRWQVLSQGLLGFGQALRYTWIGVFFGSIVPGMVSGDFAKGISLAAKNRGARDERLPISIFFDKLIGLWVLLVTFCLMALVLLVSHPEVLAGAHGLMICGFSGSLAGLAAGAGLLHPPGIGLLQRLVPGLPFAPLRSFADRALQALHRYARQPRLVGAAILLSFAIHGINSVAFWFVLQSLAIPAGLFFAAAIYPLLSLLLAVPVSISGIGVRDVFLFSVFKAFGLNPESGVAYSWLLLGLNLPIVATGGLIQLWEVFHRQAK